MTGKFQSILLGALVTGLLSSAYWVIQFGYQSQVLGIVVCCAVPTVGALLAVWHFTTTNSLTIRAGEGALMGLMACLLGYVISYVLNILVAAVGVAPSPFDVDAIVELTRDSMIEQGQDPAVIEQSEEFTRKLFWVFPLIGLAANAVFGAVVGAVGASLFKKGGTSAEEVI
jgi:hypothetical protein